MTSPEPEPCFDTLTVHPFPLPDGVQFVHISFAVFEDVHGHQRLAVFGELPSRRWRRRALMLHVIQACQAHLADD